MSFLLPLTMQVAEPSGTMIRPEGFDLRAYSPSTPPDCSPGSRNDIVVCGRRFGSGAYPLADMAKRFEPKKVIAETDIGRGVKVRAYGEAGGMDRGAVSLRVMIGIKVPF